MLISRQIGTVSQNLRVFINDATVSTGAGLANIVASSVSFSWSRNDMSTISSGTCTTGTLGTYSVSSFVQVSSTSSLGWYEFDPPNGAFVSGDMVGIHLYGAPSMAPLPILIELTKTNNQVYMSSQTVSTALNLTANADKAGYGVSSVNTGVNVTSVNGAGIVTSGVGIINVSTQTIDKAGYGVSSVNSGVNVTSVNGVGIVTTGPGILSVTGTVNVSTGVGVSSFTIPVGVSSMGVNVTTATNLDKTGYSTNDWVSTFPESYRTVNATAQPIQILYELLANITDMGNSATTRTLNSVTSHTALAITYGYDVSSNPSSIKRTA